MRLQQWSWLLVQQLTIFFYFYLYTQFNTSLHTWYASCLPLSSFSILYTNKSFLFRQFPFLLNYYQHSHLQKRRQVLFLCVYIFYVMPCWHSGLVSWLSSMLTNALYVRSQPGTVYFVLSVCCCVWLLASLCYQQYSCMY